jgi:predicted small lipoprotein YifL
MFRRAHIMTVTALLMSALALSACGKKGPLFLPDDTKPKSASTQPSGK